MLFNTLFTGFTTLNSLIKHLTEIHNVDACISKTQFPHLHAFLTWKTSKELESNTKYVQHCSIQSSITTRRWYYYCNRSGHYTPKGEGKRHLKMQGTNKIGHNCTAYLKATESTESGEVVVEYCDSHTHPIQLGHIPIADDSRMFIAQKLREGVAIDKILDSIRDNIGSTIKRQHLINRQDINNIKRQFNVEGIERHHDDQMSVCAWVKELQSLEYNPITIFKEQGSGAKYMLSKDDFILGTQTQFQRDVMKEYGNTLICMDATHGTNHYQFKLITVLVLDDFGEGVPVGWMICNKEDGIVLRTFLNSLHQRTGPITAQFFMSDDASQYYSSWNEVYGGQPRKLLCSWHVDRAWRTNLVGISNKEKRAKVYCCLRTILQILSIPEFRKTMQQCISSLLSDNDLEAFGHYFQTHYASRCEQWAYCYRVGTPANTNMSVESFHRLLKVSYLEGKHNRRIDHLLHVLLHIARDKMFERVIKVEKGKCTHRIGEINRRHRTAVDLVENGVSVTKQNKDLWVISSSTRDMVQYMVSRLQKECHCKVRCGSCAVCVHMYTCSCVDSAVHSTACKHMHVVHMQEEADLSPSSGDPLMSTSLSQQTTEDMHSITLPLPTSQSDDTLEKLKTDFQALVSQAQLLVNNSISCDAIKAGISHLKHAVHTMKAIEPATNKKTLVPAIHVAPNKNSEQQPRFHSTHKRRVSHVEQGLKSPHRQKWINANTLSHMKQLGSVVEEDKGSNSELVEWIQCSKCSMWLHARCPNSMQTGYQCNSQLTAFVCAYCSAA